MMRRLGFLVLLSLGCLPVARSDELAVGKSELPPLRWGADSEGGAPYISRDPKHADKYEGFEFDLAAALEKELDRKIQFVQYEFKSLVVGLRRGDIDFAMNGVEVTNDRLKALRMSRPYYVYRVPSL